MLFFYVRLHFIKASDICIELFFRKIVKECPVRYEAKDWEGEHRQHGDDLPEGMTRPFDQEW